MSRQCRRPVLDSVQVTRRLEPPKPQRLGSRRSYSSRMDINSKMGADIENSGINSEEHYAKQEIRGTPHHPPFPNPSPFPFLVSGVCTSFNPPPLPPPPPPKPSLRRSNGLSSNPVMAVVVIIVFGVPNNCCFGLGVSVMLVPVAIVVGSSTGAPGASGSVQKMARSLSTVSRRWSMWGLREVVVIWLRFLF